jgi:hypothetical protein
VSDFRSPELLTPEVCPTSRVVDKTTNLAGMRPVRFTGTAADLLKYQSMGMPLHLRVEGDPDHPDTWHPVSVVHNDMLGWVAALSVEFEDETPEKLFNDVDGVEFTVQAPRPGSRAF